MYTGKKPFRSATLRYAVIAVIGLSSLTFSVAAAGAANLSFIDSVKGFFGIEIAVATTSEDVAVRNEQRRVLL